MNQRSSASSHFFSVIFFTILTACGFDPCYAQSSPKGNMVITFTDVRSQAGIIAIALCTDEDQWPDEPAYEYHWEKDGLKNGRLTVTVPDMPYGTYAIAALDDENRDFEMKYAMGLPREGWGMSANPSFLKLVPPGFEECAFDLDAPAIRMEIKMNYLRKNKKVK